MLGDKLPISNNWNWPTLELSTFENCRCITVGANMIFGPQERKPDRRLGCQGRGAEEVKSHPFFSPLDWNAASKVRDFVCVYVCGMWYALAIDTGHVILAL